MDFRDTVDRVFSKDAFKQFDRFDQNANSRIPVFFCVDTSGSMGEPVGFLQTTRIKLLSVVMRRLLENMKKNPILSERATIGIVTYNSKAILKQTALDIDEVNIYEATEFTTGGQTSFSKGLTRTLQAIDQYRDGIRRSDVDTFIPLLVFMTDGYPVGDDQESIRQAYYEIGNRIKNNDLYVFPIGISKDARMDFVKALSPDNVAYQMIREDDFAKVFSEIEMIVSNKKGESWEELEHITDMVSENANTKDTGFGSDFSVDDLVSISKIFERHS